MEKSEARLSFLDIMITKSGTKIWMDTTKPQTQTLCPIYVKPPTVFWNKYTVLSCKKSM